MKPNFLILGAPRCGTTMIYETLRVHPDVFLSPEKEPYYFLLQGKKPQDVKPFPIAGVYSLTDYERLFSGAEGRHAIGEVSALYLSSVEAAENIRGYNRDMRLVAILREPAARAYSHYWKNKMSGIEPETTFEGALAAETNRKNEGWFPYWAYTELGFYARQVRNYLSLFPRENLLLLLFDDIEAQPVDALQKIFQHIGVSAPTSIRRPTRINTSGKPIIPALDDFLNRPLPIKSLLKLIIPASFQNRVFHFAKRTVIRRPQMGEEIKKELKLLYRSEILDLQEILGRDLSSWIAT